MSWETKWKVHHRPLRKENWPLGEETDLEPTMRQTFGDLDKALWMEWWRSKLDESGMQKPSPTAIGDSSLSSNAAILSQP